MLRERGVVGKFVEFFGPGVDTMSERFGSAHPGGLSAALCDGSVRVISYTTDLTTYSYLGNRQDGEVVNY